MTKGLLGALAMILSLCLGGTALAGPDEEAIARIEHDFAEVQITKDPATLARVAAAMDDGFRFTDPTSRDPGTPKARVLPGLTAAGKLVVESMDFRPFTIRIFGSTAIVEGVNTGHATFGGADVSATFAWLDVFEKRGGRWIWLFSQSGKIGDKLSDTDPCRVEPCPPTQPGFSVGR